MKRRDSQFPIAIEFITGILLPSFTFSQKAWVDPIPLKEMPKFRDLTNSGNLQGDVMNGLF